MSRTLSANHARAVSRAIIGNHARAVARALNPSHARPVGRLLISNHARAVGCSAAAAFALRLGRHLPAAANHIPGEQPAIPSRQPQPSSSAWPPPGRPRTVVSAAAGDRDRAYGTVISMAPSHCQSTFVLQLAQCRYRGVILGLWNASGLTAPSLPTACS